MGLSTTGILMGVSLLPVILLLIYIYKKDRIEKEPFGLLVGLFFLGAGATLPAITLEFVIQLLMNGVFFGQFSFGTPTLTPGVQQTFYYLFDSFFGIALVEEACKWFFTFLITHKNRHFNCLFDGVVYAVFVSLGFAAAENLLYVFQGGLVTGALRMVTAVPAHCFFAVIMGYFYSRWNIDRKAELLEKSLYSQRATIQPARGFHSKKWLVLSIVAPTIAHGFYDFCALMDHWIFTVMLFLFLGFLYFLCFRNVYVLSKKDAYSSFLSMDMVLKRHPEATAYVSTLPEYIIYFYPNAVQQPVAAQPAQMYQPVMQQQPYAQPVQAAQPVMNYRPYAQPVQANQPVMNNRPYAQPVRANQPNYAGQAQVNQPVMQQQPYAQPVQAAQPVMNNRPYAQPVQANQPYYAGQVQANQPVMNNRPYAQPVQANQPYYAQPVQTNPSMQPIYGQQAPMQQPYGKQAPMQQPVMRQSYGQQTPTNQPMQQPYGQPSQGYPQQEHDPQR